MDTQTLTIKLAAEVAEFISKIKGVESLVSGAGQRMRESFSGLWATLGTTVSVAGLGAFVKASINAMDQLDELSQRYGISVEELSGLQLAFKQNGIEQDAMASSMGKLQRAMADGNKGLAAIGVGTRNADGSLRGTSAVLLDVADKFAGLQDGAGKTALAVEIFGKSGADMVPLLNSGSDGIKDMISTAERLGLVLEDDVAAKAGNFNDTLELVGMGAQGVGRGIAARLLPTLQSLAENFLTSMTNGNRLAKTAEFLANILKGLYIGALAVVEVFSTLGKTFGSVIGAFFAAAQGNFKEAWAILKEGGADISKGWQDTAAQISAAWSGAGGDTVAALASAGEAAKKHAPDLKAFEENAKAAAKALEEVRKNDLKVGELRNKMVGEANKAESDYQAALDARNFDAAWDADQKNLAAVEARIKAGRVTLEQLQFENSLLALNTTEREVATAMRELERQGVVKGTEAYEAYAAAIKSAVDNREGQREASNFWSSIESTAKGVWIDVANDGTSAFERIGKTIKASVLDVLWQITGRQWLISIGTAVGLPGAASAAGSAGSSALASFGSSALSTSIFGAGGAAGFATSIGEGFAATMAGSSGVPLASAGSAAFNIGGALPYVGAALLALNALGVFRSKKVVGNGLMGTLGEGDIQSYDLQRKGGSLFSGPSYSFQNVQESAWSDMIQADWTRATASVVTMAESLGLASDAAKGFTVALGSDVLNYDDPTKLGIKLDDLRGKNLTDEQYAQEVQKRINTAILEGSDELAQKLIGSWKTSTETISEQVQVFSGYGDSFEATMTTVERQITKTEYVVSEFARSNETALQTLTRLASSLSSVNSNFELLGFNLKEASLSGASQASNFADLFGGVDPMNQALGSYYQNFYSDEEQLSNSRAQLTRQLATLGIDALPDSIAAYRELVDTAMSNGSETLASGLIKLSGAFAEIEQAAKDATDALIKQARASASTQADAARAASRVSRGLPAFDAPAPYTAAPGGISGSSADLATEIRALRAEVALLRTEAQATAGHTAKTAKLLDRAMPDGQSLQTTTVPA